jgi:error-prone DNA polymerase
LARLTWEGAAERYPDGVPPKVKAILDHELKLIGALGYAPYFLTVNSIVRLRPQPGHPVPGPRLGRQFGGLLCAGHHLDRPERNDLLFERFVSAGARRAARHRCRFRACPARDRHAVDLRDLWPPPLGARRRRPALSARGAVRDVGKVLGLPEDMTKALSSQVWSFSREEIEEKHARDIGLDLNPTTACA